MAIHMGPVIYLVLAIQMVAGISCVALLTLGVRGLLSWLKRRRERTEAPPPGCRRLRPAGPEATRRRPLAQNPSPPEFWTTRVAAPRRRGSPVPPV